MAVAAPLLVVDAPFLLYRSFFALPDSIHGAEGRPVNAVLGAVNVMLRVITARRPRAVVMCFGPDAAPYRTELYPGYHAQRPPVPDDLAWQFERAPGLFAAFGWALRLRRDASRPTTCSAPTPTPSGGGRADADPHR